jgi:hypothetical protein
LRRAGEGQVGGKWLEVKKIKKEEKRERKTEEEGERKKIRLL